MRGAVATLLLLGVATEGALLTLGWSEVRAIWRGTWSPDLESALLLTFPLLIAGLGAAAARWLHRRGSFLVWAAIGLPALILLVVLGLAVLLIVSPIRVIR